MGHLKKSFRITSSGLKEIPSNHIMPNPYPVFEFAFVLDRQYEHLKQQRTLIPQFIYSTFGLLCLLDKKAFLEKSLS